MSRANLFWKDNPVQKRFNFIGELPPIPKTGWAPPKEFPNLAAAKLIIIDIESKDPNLLTHGPGFVRRDAFMVGLSVGTEDGSKWYFPFAHEYDPNGKNLSRDAVIAWANDNLTNPNQPKLGTNIKYDCEGLHYEGVDVKGKLYDVQIAEPLIDEHATGQYNLNALAKKYLGEGKVEEELNKWSALAYGGKPTRTDQIKNLYRCPPELVGPYAESDIDLPLRIIRKQKVILQKENLVDLFDLECRLIPLLLKMRFTGIPVDIDRANELRDMFIKKMAQEKKKLKFLTGYSINSVWVADEIARLFDKAGIDYPRTPKTKKPSITQPFLKNNKTEVAQTVLQIRQFDKLLNPFIESYILDSHINGVIYPQFHQLKSDKAGTAPGRLSSSNPNIQNIPIRTTEGKLLRSVFVPYEGEEWNRADYSQIEYRLLVHYAEGEAVERVREQYRKNPKTDYHTLVKNELRTNIANIRRKTAKSINFGTIYGMGSNAFAQALGLPLDEAKELFRKVKEISPYASELSKKTSNNATANGYIFTILNRRSRFPFWEPRDWDLSKKVTPSRDKQAIIKIVNDARDKARANKKQPPRPGVRSAFVYTALNKLLQGSAADIMKKAMVDIHESGIDLDLFMTIHDELNWSSEPTKADREKSKEIVHIMEQAVKLKIPVLVDHETGKNWGEVK